MENQGLYQRFNSFSSVILAAQFVHFLKNQTSLVGRDFFKKGHNWSQDFFTSRFRKYHPHYQRLEIYLYSKKTLKLKIESFLQLRDIQNSKWNDPTDQIYTFKQSSHLMETAKEGNADWYLLICIKKILKSQLLFVS